MNQWAVRIRTYEDEKNYTDKTITVIAGNKRLAIARAYKQLNDPDHYRKVLACEPVSVLNK